MMGKRQNESSVDCVRKAELSYHDVPPVQNSIEHEYYQDISSESTTADARTLEFNISGAENVCIDPAKSYLKVLVRVLNNDGTELHDTTENLGGKVSVINNLLHSLFSTVEISLNDIYVTRSYSNYPYKAFLQNLLTYSYDTMKIGFLYCDGWEPDETNKFEDADNKGAAGRRKMIAKRKCELGAVLKCDLFQQHKLIPSQVSMRIRCVRSNSNFVILDRHTANDAVTDTTNKGTYKVVIESAVFRAKKVQLTKTEELMQIQDFRIAPFQIPIRRSDVTVQTIGPGVRNFTIERLHEGQLPRLVIIGLVNSQAYNSDQTLNPYMFSSYNVNSIQLFVNGVATPTRPFTPDFTNKNYVDSYLSLLNAVGGWRTDHTPGSLSYADYGGGSCLYAFNITPDTNSNCSFVNALRTGNLSCEIKFSAAVPKHALNAIIYSEFDNNIYINESRQVTTDYQ